MGSSFSIVTAAWQFPGFGTLKVLHNQGVSSETEQLLHCANHLNILTLFLFDIDKHSIINHFACYTKYCQHLNTIDKCNFSALRAKLHRREENKPTHAEKRGVYFKRCITKNWYLVQTELYNNTQLFQISQFIPNLRDRITKLLFLIYRKVPWKKLVHKVFIVFTTSGTKMLKELNLLSHLIPILLYILCKHDDTAFFVVDQMVQYQFSETFFGILPCMTSFQWQSLRHQQLPSWGMDQILRLLRKCLLRLAPGWQACFQEIKEELCTRNFPVCILYGSLQSLHLEFGRWDKTTLAIQVALLEVSDSPVGLFQKTLSLSLYSATALVQQKLCILCLATFC